jgi:hypothetical protein
MMMTTHTYRDLILTIALRHAGDLKVLTAVLEGRKDFAREILRDRILNDVEEAQYLMDLTDALAPHERAARILMLMHGPRLKREVQAGVEAVIPD